MTLTLPSVPRPTVLGACGDCVEEVQRILLSQGFDLGPAGADGVHGVRTEFALCRAALRASGSLWLWGQSDDYNAKGISRITKQCIAWGVTDYVIGVNDQADKTFKLDRPAGRFIALAESLRTAGIHVHLMSWIHSDAAYIAELARVLVPLANKCGAVSVQLDAEEAWRSTSKTRAPITSAAELYDLTGELHEGCLLGVTSYAYLPPSVAPLLAVCDYGVPQAYSQWNPEKEGRDGAVYIPPTTQNVARDRWAKHGKPLIFGLAAYNQHRPGRTLQDEMAAAFCGAIRAGAKGVAYWSRIHVAKDPAKAAFLASLRHGA